MASLKERILAKGRDFETRLVKVPGWDEEVLLRGMSHRLATRLGKAVANESAESGDKLADLQADILTECVLDPESKRPLFDAHESRKAIAGRTAPFNFIQKELIDLSGLNPAKDKG